MKFVILQKNRHTADNKDLLALEKVNSNMFISRYIEFG
jgi:hypothetical protein